MCGSLCMCLLCVYLRLCLDSAQVRGCRRPCADDKAAQQSGSGAPTSWCLSRCVSITLNRSATHCSQTYPIIPPIIPLCSDTPSCRTLLWDTLVGHPQLLRVLKLYHTVASSHLPAPQLFRVLELYYPVATSHLPAPYILRV